MSTMLYYFVFNIYEVEIISIHKVVFAESTSKITLKINPINSLGLQVPFRSSGREFNITEGRYIVEIVLINKEEGFITLISKVIVGIVGIYVESEFSLFPSYIEIHILPRSV